MSLSRTLSETFAPVVDLVYPPRCPLCGEGLAAQTGLCTACWSELVVPGEPACNKCQRPFSPDAASGLTCTPCQQRPPRHDGVYAATLYNDNARQLVLNFKHGRKIALAPMLARQVAARLPELDGEWLAVPVPLHSWRLWKRGFNQSALLAQQLAKRDGIRLCVDALRRVRATPSLGGQSRQQRAQTLKGAIRVNPKHEARIAGAQILLVDDVLTSGATTSACVDALKKEGAAKVKIACFSRVLDEAL